MSNPLLRKLCWVSHSTSVKVPMTHSVSAEFQASVNGCGTADRSPALKYPGEVSLRVVHLSTGTVAPYKDQGAVCREEL